MHCALRTRTTPNHFHVKRNRMTNALWKYLPIEIAIDGIVSPYLLRTTDLRPIRQFHLHNFQWQLIQQKTQCVNAFNAAFELCVRVNGQLIEP